MRNSFTEVEKKNRVKNQEKRNRCKSLKVELGREKKTGGMKSLQQGVKKRKEPTQ